MRKFKIVLIGVTLLVLIYFVSSIYLADNLNTDFNSMIKSISFRNIAVDDENSNSNNKRITNYDLVKLIDNDQTKTLEKLLKEGKVDPDVVNYDGLRTALLHAATELKTQSFLILAKYGADINYRDSHGNSALINATNANNYKGEYSKPNFEIVKYLVDNGAKINVINDNSYTPILGAIISNDLNVLKLLVENGGDVFKLNSNNANYLFYAENIEIIKYLIKSGLDINSLASNNKSVLQTYMARHTLDKKIVQQLIELGADFCHFDDSGKSVLDYYLVDNTPHLFEVGSEKYIKHREKLKGSDIYKFLSSLYDAKCIRGDK